MGHIQKRGDRKYQARWLDPDGRERAQTFTRKVDAERHLASVEGAKLAGAYVDRTNTITISEYAKQWAATRPHRASTAARTATLIKTHIEATPLGSRRLVAVRPSEVQAWATERSHRLAPSTLRLVVGTLRSIFNAAVRDRLVAHNPVLGLSLPRAERERIAPLTIEQVRALADAISPRCRAMVITKRASACGSVNCWHYVSKMPIFCAVRCGSSGRPPSMANTGCHPRHQGHAAPCHCLRWSRKHSPSTSPSGRQPRTARCSPRCTVCRGGMSTTGSERLPRRSRRLASPLARRATILGITTPRCYWLLASRWLPWRSA
jgi:hypothetical protein